MAEDITEKALQKCVWRGLYWRAALILLNSAAAGYWVYWRDSELHSYNIFTIFLDIQYFFIMLPGFLAALFSRFRWELLALIVLLYITVVWTAYGSSCF